MSFCIYLYVYERCSAKTNLGSLANSEDPDQPAHPDLCLRCLSYSQREFRKNYVKLYLFCSYIMNAQASVFGCFIEVLRRFQHIFSYITATVHLFMITELTNQYYTRKSVLSMGTPPCLSCRDWGSNLGCPVSNPRRLPLNQGGFLQSDLSTRVMLLLRLVSLEHCT